MALATGLCSASILSVLASMIEVTFFSGMTWCSIQTALSLHSACSYDHWGLILFISAGQPFLKFKQTEMFGIVKKIRNYMPAQCTLIHLPDYKAYFLGQLKISRSLLKSLGTSASSLLYHLSDSFNKPESHSTCYQSIPSGEHKKQALNKYNRKEKPISSRALSTS